MTRRNDKKPARTARLQVKKEILRNLSTDDLAVAAGGLYQSDPPGQCPRSKGTC